MSEGKSADGHDDVRREILMLAARCEALAGRVEGCTMRHAVLQAAQRLHDAARMPRYVP